MSNPTLLVKRLIAIIIDSILVGIVGSIVGAIAGNPTGTVAIIVTVVIGIAYQWILTTKVWDGQTIGKKLLGIKVVSNDGGNINDLQAILRYPGYLVSGFICGLGYLYALIQPEQRALHDIIAGTRVIDV